MGLGTWIKDKLLGGENNQRREEVQRQLEPATSPTQPFSLTQPAHNFTHDQDKRCDGNPSPNWQVSKDPTRYSGSRVNRDNCICGCWGKSLNDLPHGIADLSLYPKCPARRARKQKEGQARAVVRERKRAKKRAVTEERQIAQKTQAKAEKQKRTLNAWNTRHQTGEPAHSAAEAKHRDLRTYQGKACRPESGPESGPESASIAFRVLDALQEGPQSKSEIAQAIGHQSISRKLNERIRELLADALIERTIPEKPNSRLQKYRLTDKGRRPFSS